jgi:hypothetical protein
LFGVEVDDVDLQVDKRTYISLALWGTSLVRCNMQQDRDRGLFTVGKVTTRSARKLSSSEGRYAPPPSTNSRVVSISKHNASELSMALIMRSEFFLTTLACRDVWVAMASAPSILVVVGI